MTSPLNSPSKAYIIVLRICMMYRLIFKQAWYTIIYTECTYPFKFELLLKSPPKTIFYCSTIIGSIYLNKAMTSRVLWTQHLRQPLIKCKNIKSLSDNKRLCKSTKYAILNIIKLIGIIIRRRTLIFKMNVDNQIEIKLQIFFQPFLIKHFWGGDIWGH